MRNIQVGIYIHISKLQCNKIDIMLHCKKSEEWLIYRDCMHLSDFIIK